MDKLAAVLWVNDGAAAGGDNSVTLPGGSFDDYPFQLSEFFLPIVAEDFSNGLFCQADYFIIGINRIPA